MMTTIVRRGQNRKAAEAKRAKHAQRTPLPTTKEIAPVIVKQRASDDLDKMSLSQLRQLARAQGWIVLDNVTKSQIVLALREHPGGAPADAQPLGTRKSVNGNRKESKVNANQSNPGVELGRRIGAARENGYSRKDIADASGLTQSIIWRVQAKERVKPGEIEKLTEALDKIERGEIQPTRRGRPAGKTQTGRAALQSKLDRIEEILSDVAMTSKPTEYREAINRALDVINE